MPHTSTLTHQVITLHHQLGYLAPDHAMAVAGKLLETEPLPDEFAILAPALVRQAAILAPFDREKLRLAREVNTRLPHPPFTNWVNKAWDINNKEPVADLIPYPGEGAPASAHLAYIKDQPATERKLFVLISLWKTKAYEELVEGVRIIAQSKAGLLAAPILAWASFDAGDHLLAKMLLDEGIDNFLSPLLKGRLALENGKTEQGMDFLAESLNMEPFQPCTLELLAFPKRRKQLEGLQPHHFRLTSRVSLDELQSMNEENQSAKLKEAVTLSLPALTGVARDVWLNLKAST